MGTQEARRRVLLAKAVLATLVAAALVGAGVPAAMQPAASAPAPRVVSLSIGQGSIVRSASSVTATFNMPMDVPSVRFATTLVLSEGSESGSAASWKEIAPLAASPAAGGRTVVLSLAPKGRPLPPGAYAVVIGPAAQAASGAALGYASVTDFVVAPERALWERVTLGTERYDVWVVIKGPGGPVRDDQFLLKGTDGTVLFGGEHVQLVYSTDGHGRLVTDDNLSLELETYAEEEGWLRLQAPPSVPGALALDANSVTWAIDNGPGSTLGNYLYGLAKSLGEDLAEPPSQSDVDAAELATSLSDQGPPGAWASELASDKAALDIAKTGTKGYVLAQQLTTVLSEGTLSLPGAGAAGAMLHVLKAVDGASAFTLVTLKELYQAEWEAALATGEAGPLSTIASSLPSSDAFMASDISRLLHFTLASQQAVIAEATAKYAAGEAYDLGAEVAKELAADSDPMVAAVVAGLDLGFFIASFTGWDRLRAAFYQAVEQAGAEHSFVDAAQRLESSIALTSAPSAALLDGGILAWRLARNTMADFYAECIAIVGLDQWGQAVDSQFPGLEALVGVHPAQDNVPAWRSDESYDRKQASGLVPGLAQASGDAALAAVSVRFPAVPAHQVPITLCGTVISEPGQYVQSVNPLQGRITFSGCSVPALRANVGIDVEAPGVSLDLNGHAIASLNLEVGALLGPSAAGSVIDNGTVQTSSSCCFDWGVVDLAPGVAATHLQITDESLAFLVARTEGSRFVDNIVSGYGGNCYAPWTNGPVPHVMSACYGGVSLDQAERATVAHNRLDTQVWPGSGVAMLGSAGNVVEDNSIVSYDNGVYAGCNGFVESPPAHPLTHTTCTPSTGNVIEGNSIAMVGPRGPAIALDSSTARNEVTGNRVAWVPYHDFPLWDYNSCGVNHWSGNAVTPPPVTYRLSNWSCVH